MIFGGRSGRVIGMVVGALLAGVCGAQVDGGISNPILPGDHPDPTIIRVGRTYWTASTSGDWAPEFALFRSNDLHHWTAAGAVFPHTPAWAQGSFWAPELVSDGGRVLVYYVARKSGGPLCVAVATAANPAGPYEDHGPIMCQEDGSIDPAFVRDENGKPYLIWKEDGNSRQEPTRIWAQPLTADLVQVTGGKTQLLVNEAQSWEGGVVEAPYILRHGGKFFMFYAANACCGVGCHYAEGVARADKLLGPWVRDPANPIIAANDAWRCPGHGTAVETPAGKYLFLYHAYPVSGTVYLGRQSVMDSIAWGADGWPVVNGGRGPGAGSGVVSPEFSDDFRGSVLNAAWRWPVGHEPRVVVGGGKLMLTVPEGAAQVFVAQSLLTATYVATVGVVSGEGGLGLIGDAKNDVVLSRRADGVELWERGTAGKKTLWKTAAKTDGAVWLRVESTVKGEARFSYRVGDGAWMAAGESVELRALLPWDSGLRVGLVVDGVGFSAGFVRFGVKAE